MGKRTVRVQKLHLPDPRKRKRAQRLVRSDRIDPILHDLLRSATQCFDEFVRGSLPRLLRLGAVDHVAPRQALAFHKTVQQDAAVPEGLQTVELWIQRVLHAQGRHRLGDLVKGTADVGRVSERPAAANAVNVSAHFRLVLVFVVGSRFVLHPHPVLGRRRLPGAAVLFDEILRQGLEGGIRCGVHELQRE